MNEPVYTIEFDSISNQYFFESIGQKGSIFKVVIFTEFQNNVFNLGFGDYDLKTKQIDDTKVSDNGDMPKVLATVVSIVFHFLEKNPMAYIFFEGSTKSRTRLYQIAINQYYNAFSEYLELFGLTNGNPESFQKNKPYESFLIRKLF